MQKGAIGFQRRFPVGAEPMPGGGTHFRVWAPKSAFVKVELYEANLARKVREVVLLAEANGYFAGQAAEAAPGMLYRYRLTGGSFPDPASRFQPEGPHGPLRLWSPHCSNGAIRTGPGLAATSE
jgi:maltooligosyltrehalose trehalohydrolase